MQNDAVTLENSLEVSYSVQQKFTIWSSNLTLFSGIYSEEMKTYAYTNLTHNIYINFIHSYQKQDTTNTLHDSFMCCSGKGKIIRKEYNSVFQELLGYGLCCLITKWHQEM
jgi:hypothetical protein